MLIENQTSSPIIGVILPCYKVRNHILDVISKIGDDVTCIYVVDDCCPELSGDLVLQINKDKRIKVIKHLENQGVGGAMITGYSAALKDNVQIIVKIDGDGQMDPALIKNFINPIINGQADYTKGNRFYFLDQLHLMPKVRLLGNALLSFVTKFSAGYWHIFDPTNGYTAIHREALIRLPLEKLSKRYFFETDMLFRLNTIRAVVIDIPMDARYGSEVSNLKITSIFFEFLLKNISNSLKRIFYNYYLRDLSIASMELPLGIVLLSFGIGFGLHHYYLSIETSMTSSAGTVMLAALPIILGFQLILAFLAYDIGATPVRPIHTGNSNI